jgi:phosphoribosyl 1,2-cyclic phosphodiesterase
MNIYSLASGSKGNMTLIESQKVLLCVDIGISKNKMQDKLNSLDFSFQSIQHLLITHEHSDHTLGLKKLLEKQLPTLYMTQGTYDNLDRDIQHVINPKLHIIQSEIPFYIEHFKITPFLLSHDAKEPIGFVIEDQHYKIVHGADTGYIDQSYQELLKHANVYLIESNHHPEKLLQSPRPMQLKRRILGEKGHLSNDDAAKLINSWMGPFKTYWMITHISEDCNSNLDIEKAIVKHIERPLDLEIIYASQHEIAKVSL